MKNNSEIENKSAEGFLNARVSAIPNLVINDRNDNVMQLRQQERQSLSSFRLTRDPNNAFSIEMGSNVQVSDRRPLSSPATALKEPHDGRSQVASLASSFEKTVHRHAYDVLHVAEKPLSVEQINKRADVWVGHALTGLQQERPRMSNSEYQARVNELTNFKNNMSEFRNTATERGLKPADVDKTFQQIHRLMMDDAGGQFDCDTRRTIAEQIMRHAVHPTSIDQGDHNSCMEAALESMMFTKHPGDAAKFIADIALTGSFVTAQNFPGADGRMSPLMVNLNLKPDSEASDYLDPEARTFASEIFQVGAVNLAYANKDKLLHNHLGYVQKNAEEQASDFADTGDRNDTGERIVDSRTGKPIDPEIKAPDLDGSELALMARAIAGANNGVDKQIINEGSQRDDSERSEGVIKIQTGQDLKNTLALLKSEHRLPVMLKVNSNCEPFYLDSNLFKGEKSGRHAVTVRDYDVATGAVLVDNQWGDDVDHLQNNPINVSDLFVATMSDADAAKALEHMIEDDKRNGLNDPRKRMQQLRLLNSAGELTDSVYEQKARKEVQAAANRWNALPAKEKAAEGAELIAMTRDMNVNPRFEMLSELTRDGIISDRKYMEETAYIEETICLVTDMAPLANGNIRNLLDINPVANTNPVSEANPVSDINPCSDLFPPLYVSPAVVGNPPSNEIIPPPNVKNGIQSTFRALDF